ncbi:putative Rho-type GTPase-activating protein 2, partial [Trichoderma ghanense]
RPPDRGLQSCKPPAPDQTAIAQPLDTLQPGLAKMGRKPTLQPLILADSSALDDPQPSAAESASQAAASPVDSNANSKSPRSQRTSPFPISKFAVHRNRPTRIGTSPTLQPQPPRPATSTGPSDEASRQHQHQHQQLQMCRTQARDDSELLHPSRSNLDPSSAGMPTQGLRQAMTDGTKPTKSSFFQFNKAPKTPGIPHAAQNQQHPAARNQPTSRGDDKVEKSNRDPISTDESEPKSIPSQPSRSDLSVSSFGDADTTTPLPSIRKNKSKSFALLGRSKSVRDKEASRLKLAVAPVPLPSATPDNHAIPEEASTSTTPAAAAATADATAANTQTPIVPQDRALRDDGMNSTPRTRPEDRSAGAAAPNSHSKDSGREKEQKAHSSTRETGASTFFSGLRFTSTRAADLISKGLFGKSTRSSSTTDKEPVIDDEHYELKVINLPLVEQTRMTRISKRLEDSRDKTEFWMPAFPWRAIDYLNYKGTEVEGLYRVPGSGPQVKKWQRKFDEQYDVNLFEQNDLYDINIVGSMLKAWLRELPDELFPKAAQERIARECHGAEKVPQLLIDELSNLSPFNYYLLFAITCHLSLLLAHSDKNKMDFRNLCICFQPCMKIDAFCFKFLVCDWRDCWRGCKNESKFIEEEYRLFDQPPPRGLADVQLPSQSGATEAERPATSSHHSKPSIEESSEQAAKMTKPQLHLSKSSNSLSSRNSTVSTALSDDNEEHEDAGDMYGFTHATEATGSRDLRPLSPIQPLSPLGF